MSTERTTHRLTPSLRRVYTSRALAIAICASGAWRLPTCLCASPCLLRTKISQSGHSFFISMPSCGLRLRRGLVGVRQQRFPEPGAVLVRLHARAKALAIARAVALDDTVELGPVDNAEVVVTARFVPLERGIGDLQPEIFGLRH